MNDNTLDLYFLAQNTTKDDILASVEDNRNLSENIFDSNYMLIQRLIAHIANIQLVFSRVFPNLRKIYPQ